MWKVRIVTFLDERARGEVHAVAEPADAQRGLARERAANLDLLEAQFLDLTRHLRRDQVVFTDDHLVGDRIADVRPADTAANAVGEAHFDLLTAVDHALGDPLRGAAVVHRHDHVLGHVGEFAREVSRVGRLEGGVGETLAGTVRRAEVLENRQPFAEVRLDRRLDDLARRLRHQATHAGELTDLLHTTSGTGMGHQVDRIDVAGTASRLGIRVLLEFRHHLLGNLLTGVRPGVEHRVVSLAVGDHTLLVPLEDLHHFLLGVADDPSLARGSNEIVGGE